MNRATSDFTLGAIGQVAIPVRDLERSIAFYGKTLGMSLLFQFQNLAFFDCAGIRLMLTVPEKREFENHSSVIYYKVPDIQVAHETLSARGVLFEDQPHLIARMPDHELWMAFFRDPDANLLALMCEIPAIAKGK